MNDPFPLAIIESNALLRTHIAATLAQRGRFEVVLCEPSRADRAHVEALFRALGQARPGVVLLDLEPFRCAPEPANAPRPIEVAARAMALPGSPRLLAASNAPHPCFIHELMRAGAAGHVAKDSVGMDELSTALAVVAAGAVHLCARSREIALACSPGVAARPRLTPREVTVLRMLSRHGRAHTRRHMAALLGMSLHTLNNYVEDLREKFDTRDEWMLLERCRELGVVE